MITPNPIGISSVCDMSQRGSNAHLCLRHASSACSVNQAECNVADNAGTIHARLQDEMARLFVESWEGIKSGEIELIPQDHDKAIYRRKKDVDPLDHIDLDNQYTGRELLNLLRARTFGNHGFAYLEDDTHGKAYLHLRLSRDGTFG